MEHNDFYSKEFKCGTIIVSRNMLETLPSPFNTENVSDRDMQDIANEVGDRMKEIDGMLSSALLQKIIITVAISHCIPYYYE